MFQGSLEFSALGWRGVLQEALHEDAGCVRVPIELQLAFSVELNLLGNEEVIGKLLGLICLRLHVDVVEECSLQILIIVVLFLLLVVVIFIIFFLIIILVRIVKIIAVIVAVIAGATAVLIVLFVLSAEVLRRIVLADRLAMATLRYLILQALLETVRHLVLSFLLVPYRLLYVAVLELGVGWGLHVALLGLTWLLALAVVVGIPAVRGVVGAVRHGLVPAHLVLRLVLLLRTEGMPTHFMNIRSIIIESFLLDSLCLFL